MNQITRRTILASAPAAVALAPSLARAAKQYGPGVTDTEIKIGNTGPYSGPASSYSPIPKSMAAYYRMINDQGGVNGRKINFISGRPWLPASHLLAPVATNNCGTFFGSGSAGNGPPL